MKVNITEKTGEERPGWLDSWLLKLSVEYLYLDLLMDMKQLQPKIS